MPPMVEGQTPQPAIEPGNYPYQLFLPKGYLAEPAKSYPLLVFLHGSGERGDDVARVKVHGPPKIADRDPQQGGDDFIGVEIEQPVVAALLFTEALLLAKARPSVVNHARARRFGNGDGCIFAAGIDDNNFIDP